MVIEFSLGSYRSFDKIQTVSFKATSLRSDKVEVDNNNIIDIDGIRLLKTIGIYGANGSGKSNLVGGLSAMRRIVISNLDAEAAKKFMDPFILGDPDSPQGGFFQLVLLLDNKRYRYGFTLNPVGNIEKEWLFGPAEKNETYYFKRSGQDVQSNEDRFEEGKQLPLEKLRSDALFITFCSSYNGQLSNKIRNFFQRKIYVEGLNRGSRFNNFVTDDLIERGYKDIVINWMKEVGILLNDIEVREEGGTTLRRNSTYFQRYRYGKDGNVIGTVEMSLEGNESDGTRKFYSYIGRLQNMFETGGLFGSDEIDSNFHPSLLRKLIELFNNPRVNKGKAQLLFTSHDTNLMEPDLMRRDQFYFTEKNLVDETNLYSLADLKGIRNNADFARQYLAGLYGALPHLSNYLENVEKETNS